MKFKFFNIITILLMSCFVNVASAGLMYSDTFDAFNDAASHEYHYFTGHYALDTYNGTGVEYIDKFVIDLDIDINSISDDLGFAFEINGVDVGSILFANDSFFGLQHFEFSFTELQSISKDWTIKMYVNNPVPSGAGSISFTRANNFSFSSQRTSSTEVPEPSTLAIFALGMIGLASRRFKKQS